MINFLDILTLQLSLRNIPKPIDDNLIKQIISNEEFDKFNGEGYDILYLIGKTFFNVVDETISQEELKNWCENYIDQIRRLSKFNYNDNEILLYKKYFYYKLILIINRNNFFSEESRQEIIDDIKNLLSIQIVKENGAWIVKEELRILLLQIMTDTTSEDKYQTVVQNLEIAKSNSIKLRKKIDTTINSILVQSHII